jgi:HlyD family secretion protein
MRAVRISNLYRLGLTGVGTILFIIASFWGCSFNDEGGDEPRSDLLLAEVKLQDVVVEVSATGVIEPIRVIEIKSKASGEIIGMPVETGDIVAAGAILIQIDTVDVASDLRQATADLATRRVQIQITERQLERASDLLDAGMIPQDEYDRSLLDATMSRSNLIRAQTDLERARERRNDTVVRAPVAGTILSKSVERGQIIASATSQVSGGTTLLEMADLSRVQIRSLIDETDIGKVMTGQSVNVRVDAYPNQAFSGEILKVEPEGIVERDITFFPVLVHIDNTDRLLRSRMNTTVGIHIDRRDSVLALTNDAVKTIQEAMVIAPMLGIEADSIRALLTPPGTRLKQADFADRAQRQRPERPRDGGGFGGMRGGERGRMGSSGASSMRTDRTTIARNPRNRAVVFIADSAGFHPIVIKTGIQNWSVTEIVGGLSEGDPVLIPPSPLIAQQFQEFRERMQRWSALPGLGGS